MIEDVLSKKNIMVNVIVILIIYVHNNVKIKNVKKRIIFVIKYLDILITYIYVKKVYLNKIQKINVNMYVS